jgi:hypothetical protein
MYLSLWRLNLCGVVNAMVTGKTGSGKTHLTSFISEELKSCNPYYMGFSLIPWSLRARADSSVRGIQHMLKQNCYNICVLDEADIENVWNVLSFFKEFLGRNKI